MKWLALLVFFVLVGGVAALGGKWGANDWYRSLRKPSFTPPDWAFPVAWSILYIMIAISGWLVWETPHPMRNAALVLWIVQLVLNGTWSYVFFGKRDIRGGMIMLSTLWLSIALYIGVASGVSTTAALLFVPYLLWVTVAGALNWRILKLNP